MFLTGFQAFLSLAEHDDDDDDPLVVSAKSIDATQWSEHLALSRHEIHDDNTTQ